MTGDRGPMRLIYGVASVVLVLTSASVAVSLFDRSYSTPTALWGLAGIVVGSVFSDVFLRRARQRIKAEINAESNPDDRS